MLMFLVATATWAAIILSTFYLYFQASKLISKHATTDTNESREFNWTVALLITFAILCITISFYAPILFTKGWVVDYIRFTDVTGYTGDTIGGLMNPFIALAGVIVTGLAFYIQYDANQQQRENLRQEISRQDKQIKLQQFESQFYEMLKLHRENIIEMSISGYDDEENGRKKPKRIHATTDGRKVFVTMKTELECIVELFCKRTKLDSESFEMCYYLFFFGVKQFEKEYPNQKDFIELLKSARNQHEGKGENRKVFQSVKLYFNYRPFSGHASRLGHYFRHLYSAVKFVATSEVVVDYEDRMRYLKLLRAQLSNHEQILLFYNWLGDFGTNWENSEQHFFTDYEMIHNLWYHDLYQDRFISDAVDSLRRITPIHRKGKMFEIDKK